MKYLFLCMMIFFSGLLFAQQDKLCFLFNAGGGIHNIDYTPANGTVEGGRGVTANANCNYFVTKNWTIGTGIGIQSYQATATLNYMTSASDVDTDGDRYDYRIYYSDWQETQNLLYLDIPMSITHLISIGERSAFMINGGVKISIPLSSSFRVTGGEISTKGYFPKWDVELYDMPQHGFHKRIDVPRTKIENQITSMVFFELAYLRKVSHTVDIFFGGYINHSINKFSDRSEKDVYVQEKEYTDVLTSNLVDKVDLFSAGLKVGINVHIGNR